MAKELERMGLPTALVTPLPSVAIGAGANRVVRGAAITHPAGAPTLPPERELDFRITLITRALDAVRAPVESARVFD